MQHGTADMLKGEVFYVCYECPSIFFRKIILLMQERFKIYAYQLNQLGLSKKLQGIITWSPTFRGRATPKKNNKNGSFSWVYFVGKLQPGGGRQQSPNKQIKVSPALAIVFFFVGTFGFSVSLPASFRL